MAGEFTHRTHRAGGFLLMLAGAIGAVVGLGMLVSAAAGTNVVGAPALSAAVGGAVVLVFSVVEFVGGWAGYNGDNWYGSMAAAVLGLVTAFTAPLDLVGAVLLALGEGNFDRDREG